MTNKNISKTKEKIVLRNFVNEHIRDAEPRLLALLEILLPLVDIRIKGLKNPKKNYQSINSRFIKPGLECIRGGETIKAVQCFKDLLECLVEEYLDQKEQADIYDFSKSIIYDAQLPAEVEEYDLDENGRALKCEGNRRGEYVKEPKHENGHD